MLRIEVEPRPRYLYVAVTGDFTSDGAEAAYRALLQAALHHRSSRVLMDCSRVHGTMDASQRLAFGTFMADEQARMLAQLPADFSIAIYAVAPLMDPAHYVQIVSNNRGVRSKSSDNLQELLSWLGV